MGNKQQFTLWYFLAAILLLFVLQSYLAGPHVESMPYSDFKALLEAGKVRQATVGKDTIEAVIDLRGTEKLLPAAEYNEMKQAQGSEGALTAPRAGSPQPQGTPGAESRPPDGTQRVSNSEETAKLIDEEIAHLIKDAHARVEQTLTQKRSTLDALARVLLEHEVVDRATLDGLIERRPDTRHAAATAAMSVVSRSSP